MTPSQLKYHYEEKVDGYFFSRKAMKFFGDSMRNYGVCSAEITDSAGDKIEVWELYRKRPVKMGVKNSTYFDKKTFKIRYDFT